MNSFSTILAGRTVAGPASARLVIDGKEYVNFFGSGYLALSNIPLIRSAVGKALEQGVPLTQHVPAALGATDSVFEAVEQAGAKAFRSDASVYFGSGYLIGAIALASLERPFDSLFVDEHAHYNLRHAARQTGAPTFEFAHCDPGALQAVLKRHGVRHPVVLTDGVFATTGELPPLSQYAALVAEYDGQLVIDESHAFGVIGTSGCGAAEYCGLSVSDAVVGATLSKAYCAHGALLACSRAASQRLRRTPPIRGTAAGSPLSAVAAAASLNYVAALPALRKNLRELTQYFRLHLRALGLDVIDSPAPIIAFRTGTRADMLALQKRAFRHRIFIYHSDYIGAGTEGVFRCAVFSDHTLADIEALLELLKTA